MKMLLDNVQRSLEKISEDLKDIEERREKLIKGTRDAVMLCSKSIVALHNNNFEDAQKNMNTAKDIIDDLRNYARTDLYKYIAIAEQELVEAYGLKSVVQANDVPSMQELNVSGPSYLTGLLDCIGEIKRMIFDRLRSGKSEDAAKLFSMMQEMYSSIYPFAVYDNLVPGIRRKLDVAKVLIEDVRAIVTEEARRAEMIKAMDALGKKIG